MVTYLKAVSHEPFFAIFSMIDLVFIAIVILLILLLGLRYFSGSKKKEADKEELHPTSFERAENSQNMQQTPQITVVFGRDISDDEELIKEVADMYISNRVYYYSGKAVTINHGILSEKEDLVFLKFDDVAFSSLGVIDI